MELHHQDRHISVARFYPEGTIISNGLSKWRGAGGWRLGMFTFPKELHWLPILPLLIPLISLRTKEALVAKKSKGIQLGKPKGTIQRSMYDDDLEKITGWLELGLSGRKISKNLGYGSYISSNTFLKKRKLREVIKINLFYFIFCFFVTMPI